VDLLTQERNEKLVLRNELSELEVPNNDVLEILKNFKISKIMDS